MKKLLKDLFFDYYLPKIGLGFLLILIGDIYYDYIVGFCIFILGVLILGITFLTSLYFAIKNLNIISKIKRFKATQLRKRYARAHTTLDSEGFIKILHYKNSCYYKDYYVESNIIKDACRTRKQLEKEFLKVRTEYINNLLEIDELKLEILYLNKKYEK